MTGRAGEGFFDPSQYVAQRGAWNAVVSRLSRLSRLARRYLETGEEDPELRRWLGRLVSLLLRRDPELVGLSVVFPDQVVPALALARRIRDEAGDGGGGRRAGPRIVLGGAMMTALGAEELLRTCPFVDAVLPGEGEQGAARLCAGDRLELVPGLIHRDGAALRENPRVAVTSLRFLPAPDFSDLPLQRYLNPTPVLPRSSPGAAAGAAAASARTAPRSPAIATRSTRPSSTSWRAMRSDTVRGTSTWQTSISRPAIWRGWPWSWSGAAWI